jgi:hypothetical protein
MQYCGARDTTKVVDSTTKTISAELQSTIIALLANVILATSCLLLACDPGLRLRPVGLQEDGDAWQTSFDGVKIKVATLGALVGSTSLSREIVIVNTSSRDVVIESGYLETRGQRYPVEFLGGGSIEWRRAPAGSTTRVELTWEFDKPIVDILGQDALVLLNVRHGDESKKLQVHFRRY